MGQAGEAQKGVDCLAMGYQSRVKELRGRDAEEVLWEEGEHFIDV